MADEVFDFAQVFGEDYLYFYGPGLEAASEGDAELLPRWLPFVVTERDGDLALDRHRFDPTTGRATTERTTVRAGQVRRYSFSVRMFMAVELRAWLHDAGFRTVSFHGADGEPLDPRSRRMITVAAR